ncbi:MAG: DUF86 domain-containing protein [Anaerolineae bacterium]|nr:DUF86 domain-containing protein [Anaerolineae bacterium]
MSRLRRDSSYLADILEASERVAAYTEGLTYEDFLARPMVQDAVLRNIQVIGEATKKLSSGLRTGHAHIPWQAMAGMRDRIVHHYFGINYEVVWDVVRKDLPRVASQVRAVLAEVARGEGE